MAIKRAHSHDIANRKKKYYECIFIRFRHYRLDIIIIDLSYNQDFSEWVWLEQKSKGCILKLCTGIVIRQGRIHVGGGGVLGVMTPPPPFWGTLKLHKEGKNVTRKHANATRFTT